jgi:hypothetical protein
MLNSLIVSKVSANHRTFLDQCYALSQKGFFLNFRPGSVVARGFADFGFEEFYLLPDNRIISLLSGDAKPFEQDKHFFTVPDLEDLIAECRIHEIKIVECRLIEQSWRITLEIPEKVLTEQGQELIAAFVSCLAKLLDLKQREGRKLIVSKGE